MSIQVPFGGGQPTEDAWPVILDPRDAMAGDELQLHPGRFESYRDFALDSHLDRAAWLALDEDFRSLFPRVLCGRADPAELFALATAMGLAPPRRHDKRPPTPLGVPVDDDLLADIAENYMPEIAELARDRVLGPYSDLHLPRALRKLAAAVMAFTRVVPPAQRPIDRHAGDKPRPSPALRASIRAIAMAPPMLWRVGSTLQSSLQPLLPLAPRFALPGALADPLPVDTPAVLGRLVPTSEGPRLFCALPLPIAPDPAPILRRLSWELWRVRRHELRLTWEDVLRERGEVLYRSTLEQVWERVQGQRVDPAGLSERPAGRARSPRHPGD